MAEPTNDKPAEQEQSAKKKLPMKVLLIMAAVFVIEAVVIAGVFMAAGKPSEAPAHGPTHDMEAEAEKPVEELVVKDKYPNTKSGRTYIYDTEVYVVVHQKYQKEIREKLDMMAAQVSADIRMVVSRAEPNQLLEPTLATVKRQIKAALDNRLGRDEDGHSRIEDVVVTKFTQFRVDL